MNEIWYTVVFPLFTGSVLLFQLLTYEWARKPQNLAEKAWVVFSWIVVVMAFGSGIIELALLVMKGA